MEEYSFKSSNGVNNIHVCEWAPSEKPVAVLQIAHGMAEHIGRYESFAAYLNGFGILVVGNDHIGHGKSSNPEDFGFMGTENGWLNMVDDVEKLRQLTNEKYPDIPHFLMGHSMGSFVVRTYLAKYGKNIDGAVIMGTAGTNPAVEFGIKVVSFLRKINGDRHISKLVTSMAFGTYNKQIPDAKTSYDWLTRDASIVEDYLADPACGFLFTLAGYSDLFNLIKYINSDECYDNIPADKKYYVVSGSEDPVGAYGEGPIEFVNKLKSRGCSDIQIKIYTSMRHELLNEIGKNIVKEDLKRFILE